MAVTPSHVAISVLLGVAVLIAGICCAGVLVMRTPLQRLHYIAPVSMICPVLVALAVCVSKNPLSGAGLKALFIAAIMVLFAPAISHATGRAALARHGPERR